MDKIILNDNSTLIDLIYLETKATSQEIAECIDRVIAQNPYEYTNEDIYMAIDKKFGIKKQIDLSSIEEFYY